MKLFFTVLAVLFLGVSAAIYWLILRFSPINANGVYGWVEVYFAHARVPMFTGFLTLGSFLLTLQTGILQRLKDAYDGPDYERRYMQMLEKGEKLNYYGSLERMSTALSTNVILALTASAFQMTFGFHQSIWSTAISIASGFTALSLVVYMTIQFVLAHREWFKKIEDQKEVELKEKRKKQQENERKKMDALSG